MNSVELGITWKRTLVIWWAFLWRSLLATIASCIIGGIIGAIIGFVAAFLGTGILTVQWICGIVGGIIGIAVFIIPLKLILGKDFGEFRLVLLSNQKSK